MNEALHPIDPLRVFCVEDNPLVVLHLHMLIEQLGHVFAGSSDSCADLKSRFDDLIFDVALVDIDLADGCTGNEAAAWLQARGRPSIFVTGQEELAGRYAHLTVGVVVKPATAAALARQLTAVRGHRSNPSGISS